MSYIGNAPTTTAFLTDQFSGNGSTTAFTMSVAPATTSSILVAITGVVQDPSTYAVSGTTLTFSAAPPTGTGNISIRYLGIPASGVATTAYRTVTEFTATAGQTTFSVPSYTVGYIDVFRNGVRLGTADYTATSGTSVVLAAAATAGDLVATESFYVSSVLNALPTTGGSLSGQLNISSGNLSLSGSAQRIVGDFSNATVANRVLFQSSTTNGNTVVEAIPNGTSTTAAFAVSNSSSDPSNSTLASLFVNGSEVRIQSTIRGTGTYLPMTFYTNGSEQARIDTSGIITGTAGNLMLVSGTSVAASSTSVNFTGIPSWAKRITVVLSGLSANGTSNFQIQIGSGSVTTTGYAGGVSQAGATPSQITLTTGLGVTATNAAVLTSTGQAVFTNLSGNTWVGTSTTSRSDGYGQVGGTFLALGGALDRVRITTVNGTDIFDAGSINILYE